MKKQFTLTIGAIILIAIITVFAGAPAQAAHQTVVPVPLAAQAVTATPSNTPTLKAVETACVDASILRVWTHEVQDDQAMGDPEHWWITATWDGTNAKTWFVALGEPMLSLDFQKPNIVSSFYIVQAKDLAAATCVAEEILKALNLTADPYKLFIGTTDAPNGWTTTLFTGWKMRISQYQEEPIDPGGDWLPEIPVKMNSPRSLTVDNGGYLYLQLWNPGLPNKATHVIVEPAWKITFPARYQGTGWINVGAPDEKELFARWAQATNEVWIRDKHPKITKLWCGPEGEGPEGWESTMPNGWGCTPPADYVTPTPTALPSTKS